MEVKLDINDDIFVYLIDSENQEKNTVYSTNQQKDQKGMMITGASRASILVEIISNKAHYYPTRSGPN